MGMQPATPSHSHQQGQVTEPFRAPGALEDGPGAHAGYDEQTPTA